MSHGHSFRQVLSDETVRVFIEATLVGVVRVSKEEQGAGLAFDKGIGVELGSIVGGDGENISGLGVDDVDDTAIELFGSPRLEFSDADEACFAFDHGDDAVSVVGAGDGVDLPMSKARAVISASGTLGNVSFAEQYTARIVGAIALALLSGLSEMGMQVAAEVVVIPDISIDGGMADVEDPVNPKPARDLLGAPVQAQEAGDYLELPVREIPVSARVSPPGARAAVCLAGPIGAIVALVTFDLAPDGAAMSSQLESDLGV